jgi:hypothetical protein
MSMNQISRRSFLATAAMSVAATRLRAQGPAQVTLAIPAEANGAHMPEDYIGLSYEVQQLIDPTFFSAENTGLIRQYKALSTRGVLRLGGNTSEYEWWKPTPDAKEPEHPQVREVVGQPKAQYYPVTAEAVRNLAGFLRAAGWTCLYGIGMGTNTPEHAAEEAEYVAKTLGSRLQYFQIGNEVDLFGSHLRDPKTWNAKAYLDEWLTLARAVAKAVPEARFGMPDIAGNMSWLPQIADMWASVQDRPHVTTLTHHYYFGGPATNPNVNIPNLLKPATMARVQGMADTATAAADKMGGVRVRMTEGNTCYRGGKPGVSDVFAAALWSADYSLLLASNNYSGVNLHGGTGKSVANSVGGFLPGDVMLKDGGATPEQIASHPHPFYTPIATFGDKYTMEPVAYGLKFAGALCGATLVKADLTGQLQATGVDAAAYAGKMPDGARTVVILNKDAERDLELVLDFGPASGAVEMETLKAPAPDAREAHIAREAKHGALKRGKYKVNVPHGSGMRVTVA